MSWVLGIDLGTSFTAAGLVSGSRLEPIALGAHAAAIPSAVYRADTDVVVGEAALAQGDIHPDRLAVEFKRQFGESAPLLSGRTFVTPEELESALGSWVFRRACELEGSQPTEVVFSFPAFWGAYRRDLFLDIARKIVADPDRVVLVTEPEAAAIYYAKRDRLPPGAVVGVYDLGGGTFDASILRKTDDGFEVLGRPAGDDQLGGVDFDLALLQYVIEQAGLSWEALDRDDPKTVREMMSLRRNVTLAKELLSQGLTTDVAVAVGTVSTNVHLTRRELEQLAEPLIARSLTVFETALSYASVPATALHSILLVGAASRMPRIAEALTERFQVPIALDSHPKFAVCLGAAMSTQTAEQAAALPRPEALLAGQPLPPPVAGAPAVGAAPPPAGTARSRRRWWPVAIAGVVVAVLAIVGIILVTRGGGGSSAAETYKSAVLQSQPSSYWRLDDASGGQLVDSSGNGFIGTTGGGVTVKQPGAMVGSNAIAFDGSTGCAVSNEKTNPTTFTIEAWFKTTTTRGGAIVALNESAVVTSSVNNRDRHVYMQDDGRVTFGVFHAQGIVTTPTPYNDGAWHQLVATIGQEGQKLYMDGVLAGENTNSTVESYDGYWHFGCSSLAFWPNAPTSGYLQGTVDEVSIYPQALGGSTVADHYRAAQ